MHIAILSSSVRAGRKSHRLVLFFQKYIQEHQLATVEILDLATYNFPVFEERLRLLTNPPQEAIDFQQKILAADGIIIVTPEYNGGYPASLKNAVDLLYSEWKRKPIALAAVSSGSFGGTQVVTSLVFTLWKIGALLVPASFHAPNVQEAFDEEGNATEKEATDKRAKKFLDELIWSMNAAKK